MDTNPLLQEALTLHDEALREIRDLATKQDRIVEHAQYAAEEIRQITLQVKATTEVLRRAIDKVLEANRRIQQARGQ